MIPIGITYGKRYRNIAENNLGGQMEIWQMQFGNLIKYKLSNILKCAFNS